VGPVDTPGTGHRATRTTTVTARGRQPKELAYDLAVSLVDQPDILVCDLTGTDASADGVAGAFASVEDYLAAWPGVRVVVVAADPATRAQVGGLAFADRLVVSASLEAAVAKTPELMLQRSDLHLPARTTAPSMARRFSTRRLRDWGLQALVGPASLVVSELVTNSVVHAFTPVTLTLSKADTRVQVLVRDHGDGTPEAREDGTPEHTLGGRGLVLVRAVARGWGVLPAPPRGKVVWAVLDETSADGRFWDAGPGVLEQPVD
jgi:anti-sigma regulatory factor (Ser/Thr protein kinase)